jgi:hypothetical protein
MVWGNTIFGNQENQPAVQDRSTATVSRRTTKLKLTETMGRVNSRHGDFTIMYGSPLDQENKEIMSSPLPGDLME